MLRSAWTRPAIDRGEMTHEERINMTEMRAFAREERVGGNLLARESEVETADFELIERNVAFRHRAGFEAALRAVGMARERLADGAAAPAARAVRRESLGAAADWTRGAWRLGGAARGCHQGGDAGRRQPKARASGES